MNNLGRKWSLTLEICLVLAGFMIGMIIDPAPSAGREDEDHYSEMISPDLRETISPSLWTHHIPEDNPVTPGKVELGKKLFFDGRLSKNDQVSCATCHDPAKAFTDGKAVSEGIRGQKGTRSAPTVLNAMFSDTQFWDGRAPSLEEQAKLPLINPVEMGMESHAAVVEKVKMVPEYVKAFQSTFGGEVTIARIADAIAAFERTQLSGQAPFDQFFKGNKDAIGQAAKRGWDLFRGKAQCQSCHTFIPNSSPFFTDFQFHNIGIGARGVEGFDAISEKIVDRYAQGKVTDSQLDELALTDNVLAELGRFNVTRQPKDLGAFKTPTLRDVELTNPYMHDGSLRTLGEVMDFYNKGGHDNVHLDSRIRPLHLNQQEKADIVAFMKALTGSRVRDLTEETVLQTGGD